jgi:hypothetical protein
MNPPRIAAPFRRLTAFFAIASALPASGADPSAEPKAVRTTLTTDLYARAAPNGVMLSVGLVRHWNETDGDSALLRGRYAELGAAVGSNPAYAQASAFGEWVPIAPLQLRAQCDLLGFYGKNGALLQFPSASSPFGDSQVKALSGTEQSGVGYRLLAMPVLRLLLGPVLLRNETDLAWYRLSGKEGWYYEWEYDTLLAGKSDFIVSDRFAVLARLWHGAGESALLAGPAYEVTHAAKAGLTRQRVEGIVFWSPAERLGSIARPRLLAILGVNIEDPNREGEVFAVTGVGGDLDL